MTKINLKDAAHQGNKADDDGFTKATNTARAKLKTPGKSPHKSSGTATITPGPKPTKMEDYGFGSGGAYAALADNDEETGEKEDEKRKEDTVVESAVEGKAKTWAEIASSAEDDDDDDDDDNEEGKAKEEKIEAKAGGKKKEGTSKTILAKGESKLAKEDGWGSEGSLDRALDPDISDDSERVLGTQGRRAGTPSRRTTEITKVDPLEASFPPTNL